MGTDRPSRRHASWVLTGVVGLLFIQGLAGCNSSGSDTLRLPTSQSPIPPPTAPAPALVLTQFREPATGFSTTDLRDVQEQILQLNSANELIWTADGTRLPGYRVSGGALQNPVYYIEGNICPQGCAFEVRFGTRDGERRAYLTVDYGHDNPGTLVDVEVTSEGLRVTQTSAFPPGTPTLMGIVTELTATGRVPIAGAVVARPVTGGWQSTRTGADGSYRLPGLIDGTATVEVHKDGYAVTRQTVTVAGDTRFDFEVTRQ